jgi:hypothetical protein
LSKLPSCRVGPAGITSGEAFAHTVIKTNKSVPVSS